MRCAPAPPPCRLHGPRVSSTRARGQPQTRSAYPAPIQSNSTGRLSSQGNVPRPCEERRKYFRTVYDFPEWQRHRDQTRFADRLLKIWKSHVLSNSLPSIGWVSFVATAVAAYMTAYDHHLLPAGFTSLEPNDASAAFINQTSVALSLLLVFRTDESYSRWSEAVKLFGDFLDRCRDIVRQGCSYFPDDQPEAKQALARWVMALARMMRIHFQPEVTVESQLQGLLTPREVDMMLRSQHRPVLAIQAIGEIVMSVPIHEEYQMNMEQTVTSFHDMLGSCERILRGPIPVSFTRHTSRFLIVWLTALPFALYHECGVAVVPVCAGIAAVLCGIEEIGNQCEEPFGILPLEMVCNRVTEDVTAILRDDLEVKAVIAEALLTGPAGGSSSSNGGRGCSSNSGNGSSSSGNSESGVRNSRNRRVKGGASYGGGGGAAADDDSNGTSHGAIRNSRNRRVKGGASYGGGGGAAADHDSNGGSAGGGATSSCTCQPHPVPAVAAAAGAGTPSSTSFSFQEAAGLAVQAATRSGSGNGLGAMEQRIVRRT